MRLQKMLLGILLAGCTLPLSSQQQPVPAVSEPSVYMVVLRTSAHVRYSKPEVFHGFANDLLRFLKENSVPLKVDPERGTIETDSPMSVESMLNIARQIGATSLLFVTVDRPVTKWIKVSVQAYDLDRSLLWQEDAADAGSMTGKGGYKKTLDAIESRLAKHLGDRGLPFSREAKDSLKGAEQVFKP